MGRQKPASAGFFVGLNTVMPTFITPSGYSGTAELTANTGLTIVDQSRWTYSKQGYNDGATFGVSLSWPDKATGEFSYGQPAQQITPEFSGELSLRAVDWPIAVIGNELTSYTDPNTSITYTAAQCKITVTGRWQVVRQPNSNSFNSIGVFYNGTTETDQGTRTMNPYLLTYITPPATYIIQGADVTGGAQDTFSNQVFFCKCRHSTTSNNSNREYQSNSIARPVWAYSYSKSWQIAP